MIGAIADAYAKGRRAARAGRFELPDLKRKRDREFYRLGFNDETERMRARGEHPQLEMPLHAGRSAIESAAPKGAAVGA